MRWRICELAIAAILVPAFAQATTVTDAWFRALPSGLPAGGYFTLVNTDATVLSLTGAQSSACGMLMLHKSSDSGGMSMMSDVENVDVPPHGEVKFAPGGYHLMCMDPKPVMKPGGRVQVRLMFADKSKMEVLFDVKDAKGQ
jgi:periplasmic copper chaperone A